MHAQNNVIIPAHENATLVYGQMTHCHSLQFLNEDSKMSGSSSKNIWYKVMTRVYLSTETLTITSNIFVPQKTNKEYDESNEDDRNNDDDGRSNRPSCVLPVLSVGS